MGICCSKKSPDFSTPTPKSDPPINKNLNPNPNPHIDKITEEKTTIKEVPIIKHRKSSETDCRIDEETKNPDPKTVSLATNCIGDSNLESGNSNLINNGGVVVRTSGCTRDEVDAILIQCGRLSRSSSAVQTPVSGRKRSYDFDQEVGNADVATTRESRGQLRPSPNRRRTPSRERDQSQRSGSRERNGGGRRVSRSPGRRSESAMTTCQNPSGGVSKPGKMVSVPATFSSLAMDRSNNGKGPAAVKRMEAKKNAAASPHRSRSPAARANARVGNESHNQNGSNINPNQPQGGLLSLSRSNSKKAEQSPYRRNPLGEIDQNTANNSQKQGLENVKNSRTKTKEPPQAEEKAPPQQMTNNIEVNVVVPWEPELLKPQSLTRTRSSRLSRDLDNFEAQNPSPPSSYTSLLLKDIQNFHNKAPIPVPVPPCLSKTCSILGQIADLNSSNGTVRPDTEKHVKRLLENKEPPLVETEVVGMNDLIESSFQKYVTVKRGNIGSEEGEESSGSNSFVGGPQHWISSSLWETNSTDSTDCWASSSRSNTRDSRSNTREHDRKKRETGCQKTGVGQGRADLTRGLHSRSVITAATI